MYTICYETLVDGFVPVMVGDGNADTPVEFATKEEAEQELASDPEFYEGCFVCDYELIHHKTIYYGNAVNQNTKED